MQICPTCGAHLQGDGKCKYCGELLKFRPGKGRQRSVCDKCKRDLNIANLKRWQRKKRNGEPLIVHRPFTNEEIEQLKLLWPNVSTILIARMMNRNVSTVGSKARDLGLQRAKDFVRYIPQTKPIGSLSKSGHGIWVRKVSLTGNQDNDWVYEHRLVWEKHHGAIPPGHLVCFKDGDSDNLKIENLQLTTRREQFKKYNIHTMYPDELKEVIFMNGWLKRKIKEKMGDKKA